MRITAIAAHTVRWPIAGTGDARGRSERAAVLLEVRSDRGILGLGEAAPLPGLSHDTLDDAELALEAFAHRAPFDVVARPFDATYAAPYTTLGEPAGERDTRLARRRRPASDRKSVV